MLTKDLEILKHEKMKLQEEIVTLQTLYTELKEKNILQIKEFEQNIQEKNHELEDNHEIIHKLQLQCANIVKEKQELYKSYEFDKEDWNDLKEKYEVSVRSIDRSIFSYLFFY